jgi:hypothetical protein
MQRKIESLRSDHEIAEIAVHGFNAFRFRHLFRPHSSNQFSEIDLIMVIQRFLLLTYQDTPHQDYFAGAIENE